MIDRVVDHVTTTKEEFLERVQEIVTAKEFREWLEDGVYDGELPATPPQDFTGHRNYNE